MEGKYNRREHNMLRNKNSSIYKTGIFIALLFTIIFNLVLIATKFVFYKFYSLLLLLSYSILFFLLGTKEIFANNNKIGYIFYLGIRIKE